MMIDTCFVYVIKSLTTGKIYIGQTKDLDKRLSRHNGELISKAGSYTKLNKGPWVTVYKEEFTTRTEAIEREKELKSYRGREFIRSLIKDAVGVAQR